MSSSQDQTRGNRSNHPQQQRGQGLFGQLRGEFASVPQGQFKRTGFLPPPDDDDLNLGDDGKIVFEATNTENYKGSLNPFDDGFEKAAYKDQPNQPSQNSPNQSDEKDLPPPPGQ